MGYDYNFSGVFTKSFWDTTVNKAIAGIGNSADPDVIGESTINLLTKSTFTDAGWDFVGEVTNGTADKWDICEGTNYPRFAWQIPLGDFNCPDGVTMEDYVLFTLWWGATNCVEANEWCEGSDFDQSGAVDLFDAVVFFENWLSGI